MKNLVLYAPPAAGKGTQCELLAQNFGYKILSIGQILRNARSRESEVGRIIIETQDKGILTPDNIVATVLNDELKKYQGNHIIIDGYPRNIEQAKLLDSIFDNYLVINLSIDREFAKKRTLGRINCKGCNKVYNIFFEDMSPKIEGKCDICGAELKSRTDDNENSFNVRYDVYEQNAPEILEYYERKGILNIVDCSVTKEEIYSKIVEIIKGI
ncbi:MAG: adenylate kinase [Firmicutes bacterium]|nr:adenylate kinase [Bacillota bacterium]